jgi:hypothetical protein
MSSCGQPTRGDSPDWGLGVGLTTPHLRNKLVTKCHKGPQSWADSLDKRTELRKIDVRFGTWNIRSLYRAVSLMKVERGISIIS